MATIKFRVEVGGAGGTSFTSSELSEVVPYLNRVFSEVEANFQNMTEFRLAYATKESLSYEAEGEFL